MRTILTDPAVSFDKQWGLETEEVNKLIITGEHADVVELILLSNVSTEGNMAEYLHTAKASGNARMVKFIEELLQ